MKNKKWQDLTPKQKNKIAKNYGFGGANPYRTFDNWIKQGSDKVKLIDLMVNDFFKTKIDID